MTHESLHSHPQGRPFLESLLQTPPKSPYTPRRCPIATHINTLNITPRHSQLHPQSYPGHFSHFSYLQSHPTSLPLTPESPLVTSSTSPDSPNVTLIHTPEPPTDILHVTAHIPQSTNTDAQVHTRKTSKYSKTSIPEGRHHTHFRPDIYPIYTAV